MDLGFGRLEPSDAEAVSVPLDYQRLVAELLALQASSLTAAVATRRTGGLLAEGDPVAALVALMDGGPEWAEAVAILEGAFNRALAARRCAPPP